MKLNDCLAYTVCAFAAVCGGAGAGEPASALQTALDRAIDDERHALAFYAAVMETHGERRPFSNIINAERRHEAALLAQYERLGLTVPPNRWAGHAFTVPDIFAASCDMSIVAEVRNGRIYDELIEETADAEVRSVFEQLRWASVERHLRAFRRHGNGWEPVVVDQLSSAQKQQRDTADKARDAMFGALFAELSKALSAGQPADAIQICAKRAPAIAEKVGLEHGVRIGRTSFKLRNPRNAPPVWADLALDDRPTKPMYFADRSGRFGAVTPITLTASCLTCHGPDDAITASTRRALSTRYPDDQATGFAEGDLRGWFWVEVP